MVCPRCIDAVTRIMQENKLNITSIRLGKVIVKENLGDSEIKHLSNSLLESGFELLSDKRSRIANQIKSEIINIIHNNDSLDPAINISSGLSSILGIEYSQLSKLFSALQGITIEKYVILQKVEKIKELLVYNELSISEIAYKMNYSSSQHLSKQFKKTTGVTPTDFKLVLNQKRISLDKI